MFNCLDGKKYEGTFLVVPHGKVIHKAVKRLCWWISEIATLGKKECRDATAVEPADCIASVV